MKRVLYEKRGRRYFPVAEHDPVMMDAMPAGHHLVSVQPGVKSVRYDVEPDHSGLMAAIREHEKLIMDRLSAASQARHRYGATRLEMEAFERFREAAGGLAIWERPALLDVLRALESAILEAVK